MELKPGEYIVRTGEIAEQVYADRVAASTPKEPASTQSSVDTIPSQVDVVQPVYQETRHSTSAPTPTYRQSYQPRSQSSGSSSVIPVLSSIFGGAASIYAISQQSKAAKAIEAQDRAFFLRQRRPVQASVISAPVLIIGVVAVLGIVYAISKKKD